MTWEREGPRAVVLRALKLGDMLTAVPALRAVRRHLPHHHLAVAAPRWLADVVHLAGAADEVVDTRDLGPLDRSLHRAGLALNLHGKGPQSSRLLDRTGPDRLVAFAHPDVPATASGPPWREDEHEVARWCRLLYTVGISVDPTDLHLPVPTAEPLPGAGGAILLHPGASSPARRWPANRWAAVARRLSGEGHRVLLTGDRIERALARRVATAGGLADAQVSAGRTGLMELFASVARARLVISGDTGMAHVASAYGTPSVVLFGPVAPDRWGPPAGGPHTVLWNSHSGPGDPHGREPDPGLLTTTVDQVMEAAETRLRSGTPTV